ncbi:hypothetical protein DOTSEDRAFT_68769 [Dothistroma septosporum NZE10]|uniref:LIM zinc-binding domain-containing protein n=1 Tax=Dothistroma septosporum (strain NZE10 / CBS 128990) TaxID=675120 RepID=N1Q555_DOTSN|nr:hypothetical protein DOTSEDRAFT_68769 [Dothistroma septosporum NZE10]
MSLAAALAADGVRPVSFLPSVKCSDCGDEIQIAEMGDHVCGSATTNPSVTNPTNPFTLRQLNARGQQPAIIPSLPLHPHPSMPHINSPARDTMAHGTTQRPQRIPLPSINSSAANKPFLAPRPPPPFEPPLSPALSSRSGGSNVGRSGFQRSATSPAPRLFDFRPPSPELSANLDCAFPPFPTSAGSERRPSSSHSSQGRKTPTDSDRAPSRAGSRLDHVTSAEPELLDMPPKSPHTGTNSNVLQRLNTLKSGPFGASCRKVSGDVKLAETRRPSLAPSEDSRPVTATIAHSSPQQKYAPNSSSDASDEQYSQKRVPPPRPARPTEEVLRLSFLDQMSEEPARMMAASLPHNDSRNSDSFRSNTCPRASNVEEHELRGSALTCMRSESQIRAIGRRSSFGGPIKRDHVDESHKDGSDSPHGDRADTRLQDAPPVPKAVLNYQENLMHTPTGSSSSVTSSTNSRANTSSSGISPVGSVASSLDTFSPLAAEPRRYGEDEQMRVPALNVSRSPEKSLRSDQRSAPESPPRSFAGPSSNQAPPRYPTDTSFIPLESPMDPALSSSPQYRSDNAFEPRTSGETRTALNKSPLMAESLERAFPSSDLLVPAPRKGDDSASNRSMPYRADEAPWSFQTVPQPPQTPQEAPVRKQHGRRPTNAKPMCRGCGLMIEGKSVKAADGRLTGRWHKACFVCRSCQQPFMTADFYVMNNEPYCEQHYHEKNGSLCHGCNQGIEGQYLETSTSTRFGSIDKKFHPRCFTCCECRQVLAQDYFEITGRVYCERHALAAMRAQARLGSGLRPPDRRNLLAERRTTRLINPMT